MFKHIKELKKQAKEIFMPNYKKFLLPAFLIMAFDALNYLIINEFTYFGRLDSSISRVTVLLIFLLSEFVLLPVSMVLLFRVSVFLRCPDNKGGDIKTDIKNFLNLKNVRSIVLINLIPQALKALYYINKATFSWLNIYNLDGIPLLVLMLIIIFADYKFFICNYYFALTESPVKQTVTVSFKTMKSQFIKSTLLEFSFLNWQLLSTGIYIFLKYLIRYDGTYQVIPIISQYTPYLNAFCKFWCGLGFYVVPYMYITISLFAQNLLDSTEGGNPTISNRTKNVIYIVTLCVMVLMMVLFNLISPYQTWDISLKLIDDDKLELLRFFWIGSTVGNLALATTAKRYKKVFSLLFYILSILSAVKVIILFFI